MSSDLQLTLWFQLMSYASIVIVTTVTYDYLLTFPREVKYVWHRHWTWVSTMFILVRYIGLYWVISLAGLWNVTVMPGAAKFHGCTAIFLMYQWASPIFFAAADFVMILRVYAMWNQSKRILYILLFICVPQTIVSFVFIGIYSTNITVTAKHVINFSVCDATFEDVSLYLATHIHYLILRFVLSVTLLILALTQTLKQSVDMYKATKQWQPNKYMQQLLRDGILYFLGYALYNINGVFEVWPVANIYISVPLFTAPFLVMIPMMPRFIISVRELYDRDLCRRWEGIDTGFGVLSQPVASTNAAVSAIALADVNFGQREGQAVEGDPDGSEAIQLEVLGEGTRRVVEGDADDSEAIRLEVLGVSAGHV